MSYRVTRVKNDDGTWNAAPEYLHVLRDGWADWEKRAEHANRFTLGEAFAIQLGLEQGPEKEQYSYNIKEGE